MTNLILAEACPVCRAPRITRPGRGALPRGRVVTMEMIARYACGAEIGHAPGARPRRRVLAPCPVPTERALDAADILEAFPIMLTCG